MCDGGMDMSESIESIKLEYEATNGWKCLNADSIKDLEAFCADYKKFLDDAKTEREATDVLVADAKEKGFVDITSVTSAKAGDKLYAVNRGKSCAFIIVGSDDPATGMNMIGAHIDCPRLDFKPKPLYEDSSFVLAKTHYYGGIKKYQWVATPLALHGVVYLQDGTTVKVCIGESEDDPVLYISDLLPHLAQDQMAKPAYNVIQAEQLNVILGSKPDLTEGVEESDKKSVKNCILTLLNEKYGMKEADFFRAELEIVPAFKAKDVGLDRSFIGAFGQDDRVCAYTAYRALIDTNVIPQKTAVVYLSDKEEIGSVGNTGARSCWLENICLEIVSLSDNKAGMLELRRAMQNTKFLSADVTAAFDPTFPEVSDKTNVAFAGNGIAFEKYTGSRGKSGASDASAEFVASILNLMDEKKIPWQLTEMGKVDLGGGGTIAQFMADLGMDVIDCGVPVLSMHSPYEVTSKADVYWTYECYKAFIAP